MSASARSMGLRVGAGAAQRAAGRGVARCQRREQAILRHVFVALGGCRLLRGIERAHQLGRDLRAAGAGPLHLGQARELGVVGGARLLRIAAGGADQAGGGTLLVIEQRLEHVLGREALVEIADRDGLRCLQKAAGTLGELFQVHGGVSLRNRRQPLRAPRRGDTQAWFQTSIWAFERENEGKEGVLF